MPNPTPFFPYDAHTDAVHKVLETCPHTESGRVRIAKDYAPKLPNDLIYWRAKCRELSQPQSPLKASPMRR